MPCIRLQISLYYQDKKKPHLLPPSRSSLGRNGAVHTSYPRSVCGQAPPEPGDRPAGGKTVRPRPASWLAPLPAPGLGKEKRERRAVMSPCSLARRASGASAPTMPLQAAYGRPPHKSRGSSGPTVRPFASGFDGGFCRTQTAHPHHRQPWGWLRGTAPPRTGRP